MTRRFEELDHTADAAIRVWGRDLVELFANAAYGLAAQLAEDPALVKPSVERRVELEANDVEMLLVTWLGELLYIGEREGIVFVDFQIDEVSETRLMALARGGKAQEYRRYVKAVTFNELKVVQTEKGYEATVVFDV